jgi:Domain of unknown function (DUF4389)
MAHAPARLRVDDDLRRSRLTTAFRLVLVLPHLVWLALWTYGVYLLVLFQWVTLLFAPRMEDDVHAFLSRFLRYHVHAYAYAFLLADPFPRFKGRLGEYPVDLEVDPPHRQNRWTIAFRIVLAIPALVFASVLAIVLLVVAVLGWFASVALGRMPPGLRDLGAYCLRFQTQTYAYVMLLTGAYPTLAGGTTGVGELPAGYGHDPMSEAG